MNLENKVVIITGASQGIGLAAAKALAAKGASVVLAARDTQRLGEAEQQVPGSFAVRADVTVQDDVDNLIKQTLEKFGRIDVLINNAGRGMWANIEETNVDDFDALLQLNVIGATRMMQAVIPSMRAQGGGMIVNVSSMVTRRVYPQLAAYTATKHALNSLSEAARETLKQDHILVSIIRPKMTLTDFGKNALGAEPEFLRDPNNANRPPADSAEFVAEKIVELIETEAPEIDL